MDELIYNIHPFVWKVVPLWGWSPIRGGSTTLLSKRIGFKKEMKGKSVGKWIK